MRRVETVIRLASGSAHNDGVLIGLKAVAHGQDQRPGIHPLIEEPTGVSGGEPFKNGVGPLLHTPALVPPQQLMADLKGLGELDLVLDGQV